MYKLFYDNSQFVILVDGEQNSNGMIELDSEKVYILTLLPIYDKTLFLPISSVCKIKNNRLVCNISHIKIDINQYYLIPKFAPYMPPSNPEVDMQREFGEHTITVYTDNVPKLLIENKSNFISVVIPEYPEKMQEAVLDNGVLFYILCPHYVCVIFYDYTDYSVLIDKECESYTFDNNGISFKINLNDNQGRIYNCALSFDGKEYVLNHENFEYTNFHTSHEKLLGYDFMQGLLAEDYEYCQNLLSPDCPQTMEDITKLFENFEDIILPTCPFKNSVVYAICGNRPLKCTFLTENGKITKINTF